MTEQEVSQLLTNEFSPSYLKIINESHMHSSGKGNYSHFKVVIVSDLFDSKRAVTRHQLVYKIMAEGLNNGIHSLSLHLYSPIEWNNNVEVRESPNCMSVG